MKGYGVMLKYNGLYVSNPKAGQGPAYHSFLRFYNDGLVIEVASTDPPGEVVKWFHRGNVSFARGFYAAQESRIHFAVTSRVGVVCFAGELADGYLKLTMHSHISGKTEATEYKFLAL